MTALVDAVPVPGTGPKPEASLGPAKVPPAGDTCSSHSHSAQHSLEGSTSHPHALHPSDWQADTERKKEVLDTL